MGFGGTTEKLQKVASMAEDVYAKLNELRDQIQAMRETVERVDRRTAENRALLEALAAEQDVDVDAVLTETAIEEAETEAVASAGEDATEPADETTRSAEESTSDTTTDSTASTADDDDSSGTGN
ncbi:DUF5798 family protein [Halomarina oriensis]|uniref:Uncharacterized protein n=1 Tax=Halomarina oriensis TaxID=671145 RepID=A0A6B0GPC2_9EURY|nr:DUF5798 family protein [Halomarina oriensis]MWG35831.1 hypothetical protein [Halomarina oriensis]